MQVDKRWDGLDHALALHHVSEAMDLPDGAEHSRRDKTCPTTGAIAFLSFSPSPPCARSC